MGRGETSAKSLRVMERTSKSTRSESASGSAVVTSKALRARLHIPIGVVAVRTILLTTRYKDASNSHSSSRSLSRQRLPQMLRDSAYDDADASVPFSLWGVRRASLNLPVFWRGFTVARLGGSALSASSSEVRLRF